MRSFLYYLEKGVKNILENPFLNLLTTGILTISLLLFLTFLFFYSNISKVLSQWGRDVQISVFFLKDVPEERILEIKDAIEREKEVGSVKYTSRAEALKYLQGSVEGVGEVIPLLDENPLPASLDITLKKDYQAPAMIRGLAERLKYEEMAEIDYTEEWVDKYRSFLNLLKLTGLVLGSILVFSVVFIVYNTIKLGLFTRKEEISIMKLVGASNSFIRCPFIVEGAIQGGGSALAAILLMAILHRAFISRIEISTNLLLGRSFVEFLPVPYLAVFLFSGILMGVLGSLFSINNFLKRESSEE